MIVPDNIRSMVKTPIVFAGICGASISPCPIEMDYHYSPEVSIKICLASGDCVDSDRQTFRIGKDKKDFLILDRTGPDWTVDKYGTYLSYTEKQPDSINLSSELAANLNTLEKIRSLEKNWNENQAEPFSDALVNKVIALVKTLSFQPQIFPTAEESIQLEFDNDKGDYLEFELFENNTIRKFFCDSEDNDETSWISIGEINDDILRKFFAC